MPSYRNFSGRGVMESDKISVWIFPGGKSGLSFTFSPRSLLYKTLASLLVLFLIVAGVIYQQSRMEPQEESLALLKTYLERQIKEESASRENPVLRSELEKTTAQASAEERTMQAKIKLLVDEFIRVRDYEKQLKARASALNNVFNSVLELDPNYLPKLDDVSSQTTADGESLGVGGVDEPSASSSAELATNSLQQTLLSDKLADQFSKSTNRRKAESKVTKLSRNKSVIALLDASMSNYDSIPLGTPVEGKLSSNYGTRRSPFSRRIQKHTGVDISVTRRTAVLATADGVVIKSGNKGAYGRAVVIDHGNGIETLYGHMAELVVAPGEKVCRGQRIGFAGSTGRSTGPHVHYEVILGGDPTDPGPFIQLAGLLKTL